MGASDRTGPNSSDTTARSCCYAGTSVTIEYEAAYHQRLQATSRTAHRWAHSHALSAIWAGDLAGDGGHVDIRDLEMLKGIRGLANGDVHRIPVIRAKASRTPSTGIRRSSGRCLRSS